MFPKKEKRSVFHLLRKVYLARSRDNSYPLKCLTLNLFFFFLGFLCHCEGIVTFFTETAWQYNENRHKIHEKIINAIQILYT